MTFDDYYKNQKLYKEIADQINSDSGLQSSFQTALDQVSRSTDFKKIPGLTTAFDISNAGKALSVTLDQPACIQKLVSPMQTAMVGSALSSGLRFDDEGDKLLSAYEPMLKRHRMLEEAQASVREIADRNTAFASLLKTSVYISSNTTLDFMPEVTEGVTTFQKALEPFDGIKLDGAKKVLKHVGVVSKAVEAAINTSWLKEDSPWRTALDSVTRVGTAELNGSNSIFSKLIDAECQTAKLLEAASVNAEITSVAAQLASIFESNSVRTQGIARLVSDFGDFALSQHKGIQAALNAGRDNNAKWRIGLLESTSKFVDRQVIQGNVIDSILDGWEDEDYELQHKTDLEAIRSGVTDHYIDDIKTSEEDLIDIDEEKSIFTIIPQEIGYTNREDSKVSQEEAFGRSNTVTITELGFEIVNRILRVNQLQNELFKESVFKATDKNMWTMGNLGQFICDDEAKFEKMIKSFYSLVYENHKRIKMMLGDGNEKEGDKLIRGQEFECIFRIKDIRTDLEHDIDHGGEKKYQNKQEEINKAYLFYAKKKPTTAREFKNFQKKFYEDVIDLIDKLIVIINNRKEQA